jgi:hypothetical protein
MVDAPCLYIFEHGIVNTVEFKLHVNQNIALKKDQGHLEPSILVFYCAI